MKKICVLFFGMVLVLAACASSEEEQVKKTNETVTETDATLLSTPTINLATIAIHVGDKTVNVNAEIAATDEERAKGLSGRSGLPKNYGMWFVFPSDVQDAFWMKDTLISLDIIFVDSTMKIVDIIANAAPNSTELRTPSSPYRYALEVIGGFTAENEIKKGDTVEQRIGPK